MKRFRNRTADERRVPRFVVGKPNGVKVVPDGLITVADEHAKHFECQPEIWKDEGGDQPDKNPAGAKGSANSTPAPTQVEEAS